MRVYESEEDDDDEMLDELDDDEDFEVGRSRKRKSTRRPPRRRAPRKSTQGAMRISLFPVIGGLMGSDLGTDDSDFEGEGDAYVRRSSRQRETVSYADDEDSSSEEAAPAPVQPGTAYQEIHGSGKKLTCSWLDL